MKTVKFIPTVVSQVACVAAGFSAVAPMVVADETFRLEEVIVVAQKREAGIQEVPVSISSYSGDFLETSNISTIQDLSILSPSLQVAQSSQIVNQRISIRGVGSDGNNSLEPSVALYIDGVYIARPGALLGDLQDIESIDVLRGPQGTLFGRNASMGVLDIHTRKPSQELEGNIAATLENYDTYKLNGMLNTPISDSLAARVSAGISSTDGYGHNERDGDDIGERESGYIRGVLSFVPAGSVEANLRVDYSSLEGENRVISILEDTVTPEALANYQNALNGATPIVGGDPFKVNQFNEDKIDDEQYGLSLDVNVDFDDGHVFRSITAYRDWEHNSFEIDVLRTPLALVSRTGDFSSESFSQEFNLLSPEDTGPFSYVAGFYYFQEDFDLIENFGFGEDFCSVLIANSAPPFAEDCAAGPQDNAADTDFSQEAKSWAVFGQGTLNITDTADITVGLRWTEDEKEASFVSGFSNRVGALIRGTAENDLDYDDEQLTWFANLKYHPTEDIMLFATASTGYKAGGFSAQGTRAPLSDEQRTYDPEEVLNYELGVKSTLWDGRATANLTLFRTDIDDFQERTLDDVSFIINNAGELRQQGVELDVNVRFSEQFSTSFSVAYLDSEYLHFDNASALPGQSGSQDLKGGRAPFSPEWSVTFIPQWRDSIGDSGVDWFVRGEYLYTDSHSVAGTSDGNLQVIQDGYSLLNLRAGIESAGGGWSVIAFVQNAADEEYCQRAYYQPFGSLFGVIDATAGTSLTLCAYGAPRTYGVSLSYDFF